MTFLSDDLRVLALELEVADAENCVLERLQYLIRHRTVDEVLALVAEAYATTFPAGSLMNRDCREAAVDITETGVYLHERFGI